MRRTWLRATDPRRLTELAGERVVYRYLERHGRLERFRGGRILEVGPKHGKDSLLLASLEPSELVLLDLPGKRETVLDWLPTVEARGRVRYGEGNLLFLTAEEFRALGTFDLIWCLGVVYHNVEQVRLFRKLFHLSRRDALVVVESATTRDRALQKRNVVEVSWPRTYREVPTITHLPSRRALKSWLEMVGFTDVRVEDAYSRPLARHRAVVSAVRPAHGHPYRMYAGESDDGYVAGDAT